MMASEARMLVTRRGEPLIVVPIDVNGEEVEWVFTSAEEADSALIDMSVQGAIDLAGAWGGLDLDAMLDELDRNRHATQPASPLDL